MNIEQAEKAYMSDPHFRSLVDHMIKLIMNLEFSPSDLRGAAVFACIRFERISPRQYVIKDSGVSLDDLIIKDGIDD